jgi:hypothetical protein
LKRRNVYKVALAYIVMAWLVMQVTDVILNNIEAPDWVFHVILLLLGTCRATASHRSGLATILVVLPGT